MPVEALRGFSMEIPQGAVVGLLGPNGSGKTTAISCLLGLLRPQSGEISLWGERLGADLPTRDDRRIGVLLEETRLPPFLSVRGALMAFAGFAACVAVPSRRKWTASSPRRESRPSWTGASRCCRKARPAVWGWRLP